MGRYLLTGGAGFIGSAVARDLVKGGHDVVVVDDLSTGLRQSVPGAANLVVGDCRRAETLQSIPRIRYDAVFHIAGQNSGENSFDDPVHDLQANTEATLRLLQLAKDLSCPTFVYASSMAIYGDQGAEPVSENAAPCPKSFYGVGKLASEHYLRIYAGLGLGTCALRLFNVYGPGQDMDNLRQGMASIFLAQAVNDRRIHVKGSPDRFRDFVYVEDVVRAFRAVEKWPAGGYTAYNVANGVRTTVGELVSLIGDLLPYDLSVRYEGSTPGDQFRIVADVSAVRDAVGWVPTWSLQDGMRSMLRWATRGGEA